MNCKSVFLVLFVVMFLFAIMFIVSSAVADAPGKTKDGDGIRGRIGKEITLTGVGHNTKDGIYLNDYVIDDFQLPAGADGKMIKLQGLLKDVVAVEESGIRDGVIVQAREGTSIHLRIAGIKWTLIDKSK